MTSDKDIIRMTYEASPKLKAERPKAALAPDASWTAAAGFIHAGFEALAPTASSRLWGAMGRGCWAV